MKSSCSLVMVCFDSGPIKFNGKKIINFRIISLVENLAGINFRDLETLEEGSRSLMNHIDFEKELNMSWEERGVLM